MLHSCRFTIPTQYGDETMSAFFCLVSRPLTLCENCTNPIFLKPYKNLRNILSGLESRKSRIHVTKLFFILVLF